MPATEWLKKWEQIKEKTVSPVDLNTYFEKSEIAGKKLAVMEIGPCSLPSGRILVRDPLVYLADRKEKPYFLTAPAGTYQTEICVVKQDESGDCARYAAVRLRFTEKRPVRFYEALIGDENLDSMEEVEYFGFAVEAGLGSICDEVVHQAVCDWSEQWDREHPGKNQYYDYFAPLFAESYKAHPELQREDGDFLNWQIPGTEYHLPIFQSGFGDGVYPVYWGMDETGNICQIVMQFIDIELAYGETGNIELANSDQAYIQNLKIEDVPWHRLATTYGLATDFPVCFRILWEMTDLPAIKAALDEIGENIEHQGTLWHATPFAMVFFVRIFERAIPEIGKNDCADCITEALLDLFRVIAECFQDANSLKHAEPLSSFSDLLREEYLWSEEFDEEQDLLRYEDDEVCPDDLFYSFWYYAYLALLPCSKMLDALNGTSFAVEAEALRKLL